MSEAEVRELEVWEGVAMTEEGFPGEREMVPDMSSLRFGEFEPGEAKRILARLPDVPGDADDVLVVTSLRIRPACTGG